MTSVAIAFIAAILSAVSARDLDGRYAGSPWRAWFEAQLVPGGPDKGKSCCKTADGTSAIEDIRDGQYWVTFETEAGLAGPMPVPTEVVLTGPNKRGVPVVWYYFQSENGKTAVKIRCYAPGTKV